jgi:dTDP-4-dehydrorhamnose 3,5-epimerase
VKTRPLSIAGAWEFAPTLHEDRRGGFLEMYKADLLEEVVGHRLSLQQANCSVSRRGVVRGIHWADVPPGQAKYITCLRGLIVDVVVDLRLGSATFGQWDSVVLDDVSRRSVYLAEGLGHAFMALADDTVVTYLCSEPYRPGQDRTVNPLDPDLAIDWPREATPLLSDKDQEAPALAAAQDLGLLPDIAACELLYADLRMSGSA